MYDEARIFYKEEEESSVVRVWTFQLGNDLWRLSERTELCAYGSNNDKRSRPKIRDFGFFLPAF